MPQRVKPSFVIFDMQALRRSALSVRVPGCQHYYYRAMHFSAKRGIAIACRLSVSLSPSVGLSVTLVDCDRKGWNISKII